MPAVHRRPDAQIILRSRNIDTFSCAAQTNAKGPSEKKNTALRATSQQVPGDQYAIPLYQLNPKSQYPFMSKLR